MSGNEQIYVGDTVEILGNFWAPLGTTGVVTSTPYDPGDFYGVYAATTEADNMYGETDFLLDPHEFRKVVTI